MRIPAHSNTAGEPDFKAKTESTAINRIRKTTYNCKHNFGKTPELGMTPSELGMTPSELGMTPSELGMTPSELGMTPEPNPIDSKIKEAKFKIGESQKR